MTTLVLFGSFALCLILQVPIGIALGASTLVTIFTTGAVRIDYLAQNLVTSMDSFPLMAVPFFILAGEIMGAGGISDRLLKVANRFFAKYTGGLGIVAIAVCMFFAAISGSGPATVAAIGGIMIPEMVRQGYDKVFATALVATAGSIGVIIPPSIPMVIYGVSSGESISALFLGGFFPGLIVGLVLIAWTMIVSRKRGYKGSADRYSSKEKWDAVWDAKWALLVPVVILGGIYGGIFTPTEAAAVAVAYGAFIGLFVYRELKFKDFYEVLARSALLTATVMVIIGTATTFGKIMTLEQVPNQIAMWITSISTSKLVVMSMVMALLLLVGCFMETLAAIIILTPILLPVVTALGFDPVHFGILMTVNLAIGFITPPLGVNLFVGSAISGITIDRLSIAIIPWILCMMISLIIFVLVPEIVLWLPQMLM